MLATTASGTWLDRVIKWSCRSSMRLTVFWTGQVLMLVIALELGLLPVGVR